ncbi:hypothetical protein BIW11_09581, partial [Tropilaelaps mercedesae]
VDGCKTMCSFHERDNELYDTPPVGPLETQEVVEDVKYQYDLEENTTNIEWDYKPDAQLSGVILVVGTNASLNDTTPVNPQDLYIIGRTYYRNITIEDEYLDAFCTIRLATVDSEKKMSLLNVHTEHLKRHTNRCHSAGVHHHPPIISSVHVTDLRKHYNLTDQPSASSGAHSGHMHGSKPSPGSRHPGSSATDQSPSSPESFLGGEHPRRSDSAHPHSWNGTDTSSSSSPNSTTGLDGLMASNAADFVETPSNASAGAEGVHRVTSSFTSHLELFPAPVLLSLSRPRSGSLAVHLPETGVGSDAQGVQARVDILPTGGMAQASSAATRDAAEMLKAVVRWEPFINSSDDGSCTKYKVTWKVAVTDKVAGGEGDGGVREQDPCKLAQLLPQADGGRPHEVVQEPELSGQSYPNVRSNERQAIKCYIEQDDANSTRGLGDQLTCSTNASLTVERNSVYHVWVSLFGHEEIRTQQLTVETAHAQFAKLHALDACHGCVRGDYTTGVSAALASLIVLAVAVFLLIKSYRSYALRDHKLRNSGSSFLMPSSLLGEPGAKPTMHVIEPKMLTSTAGSSRASAHVTITPIAAHGAEGHAPSSLRSNGPYEPLSLEDEEANYFVFDLPKNYTAV